MDVILYFILLEIIAMALKKVFFNRWNQIFVDVGYVHFIVTFTFDMEIFFDTYIWTVKTELQKYLQDVNFLSSESVELNTA